MNFTNTAMIEKIKAQIIQELRDDEEFRRLFVSEIEDELKDVIFN